MSQMTPEFILGYRAMLLDGIAREAECTKRVIAAIPDAASSYKPDPNARTAKELAWRIAEMSAEQLLTPVEFFGVFNLPAALYLGFLNNHSIHHRGELTTYLRPMGSKVPSIYGGSYDEPFMPPA